MIHLFFLFGLISSSFSHAGDEPLSLDEGPSHENSGGDPSNTNFNFSYFSELERNKFGVGGFGKTEEEYAKLVKYQRQIEEEYKKQAKERRQVKEEYEKKIESLIQAEEECAKFEAEYGKQEKYAKQVEERHAKIAEYQRQAKEQHAKIEAERAKQKEYLREIKAECERWKEYEKQIALAKRAEEKVRPQSLELEKTLSSTYSLKQSFPKQFEDLKAKLEADAYNIDPSVITFLRHYEKLASDFTSVEANKEAFFNQEGAMDFTHFALGSSLSSFSNDVQQCQPDGKVCVQKSTLFFSRVAQGGLEWLKNHKALVEKGVDLVNSMTSGVSLFKDTYEVMTGTNFMTGEKLSPKGRVLAGVGVLTGEIGSQSKETVKWLAQLEDSIKTSQKMRRLVREGAKEAIRDAKEKH